MTSLRLLLLQKSGINAKNDNVKVLGIRVREVMHERRIELLERSAVLPGGPLPRRTPAHWQHSSCPHASILRQNQALAAFAALSGKDAFVPQGTVAQYWAWLRALSWQVSCFTVRQLAVRAAWGQWMPII